MRKPTIHVDGSSPDILLEDLSTAMNAIREARMILDSISPNARDYYPQGETAINEAVAEHLDRIKRLNSVLTELEEMSQYIVDEMDKRIAARR